MNTSQPCLSIFLRFDIWVVLSFTLFVIIYNTFMKFLYNCFCGHNFHFSLGMSRNRIVGPWSCFMLNFVRNYSIILKVYWTSCNILPSHQQICMVPHSYEHFVFSIFYFSHSIRCGVSLYVCVCVFCSEWLFFFHKRNEINNFQYFIHLYTLESRLYHHLRQYPVFPGILIDYDSEINLK